MAAGRLSVIISTIKADGAGMQSSKEAAALQLALFPGKKSPAQPTSSICEKKHGDLSIVNRGH